MSNEGEEQQSVNELPQITEAKSFVENKQVPLTKGLTDILNSSRIVLVGERHVPGGGEVKTVFS